MRGKPILLVEDNPDDVELTRLAFRKNKIGNEIVVARDGVEALDYLFGRDRWSDRDIRLQPQVILLDLNMPRVGGLEVLERIREDERTRRIPVVVLTSSDEEQDLVRSYDIGANSFIRKPVELDKFIEAVRNLGLYWLVLNEGAP